MAYFISDKLFSIFPEFCYPSLITTKFLPSLNGMTALDVAIDDPTKISYITDNRLSRFDTVAYHPIASHWKNMRHRDYAIWDTDLRQRFATMAKPSKVFSKLFPGAFSNQQLEALNLRLAGQGDYLKYKGLTMKLVDGYDIAHYYHEDRYASPQEGSLWASCMRYDSCEDYFDLYCNNTDNCKLLIAIDEENNIHGRALVWIGVQGLPEGFNTLMDRIYTNTELLEGCFKQYAKDNKCYYKAKQSYSYKQEVINPLTEIEDSLNLSINLSTNSIDSFPYIDTFTYSTDDLGANTIFNNYNGKYEFTDTEGNNPFDKNTCRSEWEDRDLDEEDAQWCDDINDYCHVDDAVYIDSRGSYYPDNHDDITNDVIDGNGGWYFKENVTFCEDIDCYAQDDYGYSERDDCYYYHHEWDDIAEDNIRAGHAATLHNGKVTHQDDVTEIDGEFYHDTEKGEVWDNCNICGENFVIIYDQTDTEGVYICLSCFEELVTVEEKEEEETINTIQ